MGGIGGARIFGSSPSGGGSLGLDALCDAVVDAGGGGDYALISAACAGESQDAIICVAPGSYTETGDITMKRGQRVCSLGGNNDVRPVVNMDAGSVLVDDYCTVKGLYFESNLYTLGAFNDGLISIRGGNTILRDLSFEMSGMGDNRWAIRQPSGTSDNSIQNIRCYFSDSGQSAVSLTGGIGNKVKNVSINDIDVDTARFAIDFTTAEGVLDDVFITNSNFAIGQQDAFNINVDGDSNRVSNIFIDNTASSPEYSGMKASGEGNIFSNIHMRHVYTAIAADASVGSEALRNSTFEGIYLYDCSRGISTHSPPAVIYGALDECIFSDVEMRTLGGNGVIDEFAIGGENITGCIFSDFYVDYEGSDDPVDIISGAGNMLCNIDIDDSGGGNTRSFDISDNDNIIDNCRGEKPIRITGDQNRIDSSRFGDYIDSGSDNIINGLHQESGSPGPSDDSTSGYMEGDRWRNTSTGVVYTATSVDAGSASWGSYTSSGYDLETDIASPVTVEVGEQYDNDGAGGAVTYNLPSASRGRAIRFVNMENEDMELQAAGGEQIQIQNASSSAGGTATSSSRGDVLELIGMDSSTWYAVAQLGSWTLT